MRYRSPQLLGRLLGLTALTTLATALATGPALAGVTYSLRDARFFGETTQRETTEGGTFTPGSVEDLTVNFSNGVNPPTFFSAVSTNQGTPFRLGVNNNVSASANTALTFNSDFVTPTTIVSIVSSTVQETGVTVTGGSGTAYLLPTFRLKGSFSDGHPTAFGSVGMCAGINVCTLSGVANSSAGPSNVDTTFTPGIGTATDFTFGDPFTFFFFITASINSFTTGNLAPGALGVHFTDGLELLSVAVVDANGDPIPGAIIHSEFLDWMNPGTTAVPEPSTLALLGLGLGALFTRRRAA